jgi:hypothetical protein
MSTRVARYFNLASRGYAGMNLPKPVYWYSQ